MIDIETVRRRNELYAFLRRFFNDRGYIETETPLLTDRVVPESSISLFRTESDNGFGRRQPLYLIPSPEVTMKKILAEWPGQSIFQIGKSFRNGEVKTGIHNREFTMLEYYTRNADMYDSLRLTETLFSELPFGSRTLRRPFRQLPMAELFTAAFREPLDAILGEGGEGTHRRLGEICRRHGLRTAETDTAADLFNLLFVSHIEPNLPKGEPVAILEYPSVIATTAALCPDGLYSQRWELYVNGCELCICYTEGTDLERLRPLLAEEAALQGAPADETFIDACGSLGHCSGNALGVDRLLMLLLEKKDIEEILIPC